MTAAPPFLGREIAIAVAAAALAQMCFVGLFFLPPPPFVEAEVSDDRARPLSVAITPVPLLKLGSQTPSPLPDSWQRARAPAAAKAPPPDPRSTAPSTKADHQAAASKEKDAGIFTPSSVASHAEAAPTEAPAPASSQLGAANGSADGTETDPLKARAADMYRAQLASWFVARFNIRGKVPFDQLRKLSATAVVSISSDRHVAGFSITKPSGDSTFDDEVRATLGRIQSGGAELPAPPPAYPDMLAKSVPVSFRCTVQSQCE